MKTLEIKITIHNVEEWSEFCEDKTDYKEELNELRMEIQDSLNFLGVEKSCFELNIK